MYWLLCQDITKQSVIGTYKEPITCMDGNGSACTPNTRINYASKDCPLRKIVITASQYPRARSDILRLYIVRNIDNVCIRGNSDDHTLHYADVAVTQSEIGQQGDNRSCVGRLDLIHL